MIKVHVIVCFTFFLATLASARNPFITPIINDSPFNTTKNYTHVCDPSRFEELGLDMNDFAYCDKSLPYDVRVKDLIDQMSLREKANQTAEQAFGVPRIGLPKYDWWSEALHGVSNTPGRATFFDDIIPGATSFPVVIGTAAAFNETLWKTIGQVISTEARAMRNLGHAGLTFWSPNINVARDPRWGRTQETPGEDPYVVGIYAKNFVRGLQDVEGTENFTDLNNRPLKVAACCKHYAAYDLDKWLGVDRHTFDARVHEQDMAETFLRPFEMCVKEGDVSSVMCSFNKINGIPACADTNLLKNTIRGEWGLHGYIVADCDSVEVIYERMHWLNETPEDAAAKAIKAGLDLDCGYNGLWFPDLAGNAVVQGKLKESEIDNALKNLYTVLMRLGFFDGMPQYESLSKSDICSEEHIELARETAREGIVLLKNDNNTLPLSPDEFKSIAVVGPHANATKVMIGNYAGIPCKYVPPIDGFGAHVNVKYEMGCGDVHCNNDSFIFPAMQAAKNEDATVILAGLALDFEREEWDRDDLLLPGYQQQMIEQVAKVSKGPVILVLMSGGVLDISFAKNSSNIHAILWAGYPGEQGGNAIADIVLGKYNPGGKLPLTWFENSYIDMLPMTSMQLRPDESLGYPGRTYKFYDGPTVYPFGHGLSYTNFTLNLVSAKRSQKIKLNKYQHCRDLNYTDGAIKPACMAVRLDDMKCDEEFDFEIEVNNVGKMDGSEVVMVYAAAPPEVKGTHIKQLIAFDKVFVPAGGSKKVKFALNMCKSLSIVDDTAYHVLAAGTHSILIGDGAVDFPFDVSYA